MKKYGDHIKAIFHICQHYIEDIILLRFKLLDQSELIRRE